MRSVIGVVVIASVVALNGCVSRKVYKRDVSELEGKVAVLEEDLKKKNEAILVYEKIYKETVSMYKRVCANVSIGRCK